MSVVTRFAPASLTAQQYDDSISRIQGAGDFPPDARLPRVLRRGRKSTRQRDLGFAGAVRAFGERLMPLLAEAGIDPGEPEVIEIHNIIKR